MHTSKDDYLINTLRFVSTKEETQIYSAILPESLTSEMKDTQAYQTYLGFAIGATPPKKAQKFKKPASAKLTTALFSTKTPTGKSKRVKRPAKKSIETPARGVVIRETPEMPLTKKKEKVDVTRGKGIELLSQVALTEDAQFEEVRMKSMSEGTSVKLGVLDVAEEELLETEVESWGNDDDDSNNERVLSDEDSDQEKDNDDEKSQSNNELELDAEHETDESESSLESDHDESEENEEDDDDEDETKITDKEKKTEVPVTSSSHLSDLATKFLNFSNIPYTDAEIVSPLDVYVHHELPSQQTPTLLTVPVLVITDSSQTFFSTYGKVYSLKRSRKDKDEDPSAESDRGLKKRKTNKDTEPAKCPKAKESQSTSSKGDKSKSKSFGKSI
nr:hypothetical protein [Tanacetum cinerariifolium]